MLTGPSSPALERFRLARAKREELSLARELRNVLSREEIVAVWNGLAASHLPACRNILRLNLAGEAAIESTSRGV